MQLNGKIGAGLLCLLGFDPVWAQGADVSVKVELVREQGQTHGGMRTGGGDTGVANVVAWLSPMQGTEALPASAPRAGYTLTQKDRQFSPHLLVVPLGSSVEFPNLDPFFHNVFSLFNGKRFDLGLYEAHSHRSVRFDREGVSYIFCNIHPDMGAVIVALGTPYYALSAADGTVTLHNVPPGSYRLNLWAENVPPARLAAVGRTVQIGTENAQLGTITLATSGNLMKQHLNKFGDSYKPAHKDPY